MRLRIREITKPKTDHRLRYNSPMSSCTTQCPSTAHSKQKSETRSSTSSRIQLMAAAASTRWRHSTSTRTRSCIMGMHACLRKSVAKKTAYLLSIPSYRIVTEPRAYQSCMCMVTNQSIYSTALMHASLSSQPRLPMPTRRAPAACGSSMK